MAWSRTKTGVTLGVLFVALSGGALGATGPIVRAKVARVAAKRHLLVDIGSVRPGFFSVTLKDVRVRPDGIDGVVATLPEVKVSLSAAFAPTEIAATGGEVVVHGDPEELREKFRALRGDTETTTTSGSKINVAVKDLKASLSMPNGTALEADGVGITRDETGTKIHVQSAQILDPKISVTLSGGDVALASDNSVERVALEKMNIAAVRMPRELARDPDATANDNAPPPLPVVAAASPKPGKKAKLVQPASVAVALPADAPLFPIPDPRALRAKLNVVKTMALARIPKDSAYAVSELTLSMKTDTGDDISIGPGPLTVKREGDDVRISFSADAKTEGLAILANGVKTTPLSLEAEIPLDHGDATIALTGGPVTLARLGLKENAGGLVNVAQATLEGKGRVVLSDDGSTVTFDVDTKAKRVALKQPRLSIEPIENLNASISARGVLTSDGLLRLDDARASIGETKIEVHGSLEQTADHASMAMNFDVPIESCQAMIDTAPAALLPTVRYARFAGTFAANGHIVFDTRKLDDLMLDYQVKDECRITEVPRELSRERFTHAFQHHVVLPDGKIAEERTGPGTDSWTDLDHISPFMIVAVQTTEDGGFFRHHGFNHPAFRNSLVANLKARRFVRGASTISMQLTKNIFLSRTKSLSRKLEELILTDYLEQVFSKDELMELYLNVIEFGPDIYGITKAADTFFGRKPEELSLAECLYLSSLLPSPIRYFHMKERGEVPDYWMKHIYSLMEIAAKNGRISQKELDEGLTEKIEFWKDGQPRPAPRPPVLAPRNEGTDDNSDWKPVD